MKHHYALIDALDKHDPLDRQWFLEFAKECLDVADRIVGADAELALLYLGHASDATSRAGAAIRATKTGG